MKRSKPAGIALLVWCLFIGLGAMGGGLCMLIAPDGKAVGFDALIPYFQVLPFADILFQNFIFPGISLIIVNGLTNLTAAYLIIKKKPVGYALGGVFGVTLMLWITIQFIIFPMNFMSTIYFIFGFIQAITGFMADTFRRQEDMPKNMPVYRNIGTDPSKLVVYFSRLGYGKRLAYDEAERTGAMLYEIKALEKTEGTLGFWWCGRFGMHRWSMMIEKPNIDIASYDEVTIVTPVWVFHVAPPVKCFCMLANGSIKSAKYIMTHFQRVKYESVALEMDSLIGIKAKSVVSVVSRRGRRVKRFTLRGEA